MPSIFDPPTAPAKPASPKMRAFGDIAGTRDAIHANVLKAAQGFEPVTNSRYTLSLADVKYAGPERYTPADEKHAILANRSLTRRLQGSWVLTDNASGAELARRNMTIAHVPYLADSGTFVHNGSAYTMAHQMRLLPGVFARRKSNDELETHVNVSKGLGHKVFMDPETGVFKIHFGQAHIPLYPLLKAMGTKDAQLREAWDDLLVPNMQEDDPQAMRKLYAKLNRYGTDSDDLAKSASVIKAIQQMELDPEVTKRTLGKPYRNMSAEALIDITKKLRAINRGEAEEDDRDHLAFQRLLGPEDYFGEALTKAKSAARKILWKATATGNLDRTPTGAFTDAIQGAMLASGLAQPLEEVNTAEIFDQHNRVTRMGAGGIPSLDAVPDESRAVHPSQFGFVDFLRTPESSKVGVDLRLARGAMKGEDGKLYTKMLDPKTGQQVWKTPQDVADSVVAFPREMEQAGPYVAALIGGKKIRMVPRAQVQYVVPQMEDTFSPLANMIPMKGSVKGQRAVMAARMLTQALPLVNAEAPWVQGGIPGEDNKSYEEEYGTQMGARRFSGSGAGRVVSVTPDLVVVQHPDGKREEVPLYNHMPFNRKTFFHQTPAVQPGDTVQPGQLLATSNFTNAQGTTALGLNARVAYVPWGGANFEDASVVSRSFADRAKSTHMYQHGVDWDDRIKKGLRSFQGIFPAKYDKRTLVNFDEHGVIKPGTEIKSGSPLILVAREREPRKGMLHRARSSFTDDSVTWDHHEPGIVTDVVHTDKGVAVVVKTEHGLQVGDKLSGRYGDKGIVASIVDDDDMPHSQDGQPYEVVLNPGGINTRTNPSQIHEAALGKLAAISGKPYKVPDFDSDDDRNEWVLKELAKHGSSIKEAVIDPLTGRKIPDIYVGNRWLMKLHHTAECYDDQTEVLTERGWKFWRDVVETDALGTVRDGELLFEVPSALVAYRYIGKLNAFSGRYVDYCVTPNHRMYVDYYYKRSGYEFADAATVHGRRFRVQQFGFIGPTSPADPPVIDGYAFTWEQYAALAGWWVTEGCVKLGAGHGYTLIYQSEEANPENFADIEALLQSLPFAYAHHRLRGENWGFRINSIQLAKHFAAYGLSSELKSLPRSIQTAPLTARRVCLEKMMAGDGNYQETPTGPNSRFTTTSLQLANDFQELSVRSGYGGSVRPVPTREANWLQAYTVSLTYTRTATQIDGDRNKEGFRLVDYDGVVYCATVSTGLLYVRRNGKPLLCGNSKNQGRGLGEYTMDELPAKGGPEGAKRVGMLELNALLSHGATEVVRDINLVRGQANPIYWSQTMAGFKPPTPRVPPVYRKYVDHLRAAGMNPVREGTRVHLMAMTDKAMNEYVGDRELKNVDTVDWNDYLKPKKGGLFDPSLTGGPGGNRWSYIQLHKPLPNPVMEEPIRRVLGLTEAKLHDVIAGKEKLDGQTGPEAIERALKNINVGRELDRCRAEIASGKRTARDTAIRRLKYLKSAERLGIHPSEWMLSRVPVLPPAWRPVSTMGAKKLPLVADPNYLYKEVFEANQMWRDVEQHLGDAGDEQLAAYKAFKAVTGLGDPIQPKNQERRVKGILKHVFGSSPKTGAVQYRLLGRPVDLVGRSVIAPDPDLDMDSVGVPESRAWDIYRPFVVRHLVRKGMPRLQAARAVESRSPDARQALQTEMESRPVIINRAPTLHRYGVMAAWPRLVKGDVLKISPLVVKGFNADFDGDAMQFHVPATDEAVDEAVAKMLPSRNLFSAANFKVHYTPLNEYVGGLYEASSRIDKDKSPAVFATEADAIKAYKQGRINVGQEVHILN